jgi:ribonuclease E
MKKEMLINVLQPEECRIAIVEDGILEELYVERTSHESYVGNIYKGRIVNIEPSIQAAFVDFGVGRNGFLHVSDVEPAYYRHLQEPRGEGGRREGGGRGRRERGGRRPDDEGRREGGRRRGRPEEARRPRRPPDIEDEAPARPEDEDRGPAGPEEPAVTAAAEAADYGFEAAYEPAEPQALTQPADEAGQDAEALAGQPEAEEGRGRRRGRGRTRRKPDEAPEQAGAAGEAEPAPEAKAGPADEPEPSGEVESESRRRPERPRPMESAERRTKEEEPELDLPPGRPAEDREDVSDPDEAASAAGDEGAYADSGHAEEAERPVAVAEGHTDDVEEDLAEDRMSDFDEEADLGPPRRRRDDRRRNGRRPGGFGRPGFGRPKPLIQDIFRRGQEVLVQVIKEGIGTKGPTLSTYISIAGRYLVLMPGLNRIGVSRKITDEEQRRRLKEILSDLEPPRGLGFIIRTAGLDRTKKELQRDLAYLSRLWQVVVRRIRKTKSPCEIYQESDMITRTIRDTFTGEIDTIWVDEPAAFAQAQEFMQIVMPRYAGRIKLFEGPEPMFHKYGIEEEITRIQRKHVPLPNGGSLVIEPTEALVAIDVNSGNFRADNNAEETAYQMNLIAAREVARQLRLRDLGGVIVNDFIDMREDKHRRAVEKALRDAVRRDRARTKILKISQFGIIEMTRQRIRPSLKRSIYQDCPHCQGNGQVKTCESMSIEVMRMLLLAAHRENVRRIHVHVQEDVAAYLSNRKRKEVAHLEEVTGTQVMVTAAAGVPPEFLEFACYDNNNNEVKSPSYDEPRPRRR